VRPWPGARLRFDKFDAIPDTPADDPAALHIRLGTAVFVMACLNFLLGFVRPHKGRATRVLWYASHFMFGTVAVALSWYVIFTGMNLSEESWRHRPGVRPPRSQREPLHCPNTDSTQL